MTSLATAFASSVFNSNKNASSRWTNSRQKFAGLRNAVSLSFIFLLFVGIVNNTNVTNSTSTSTSTPSTPQTTTSKPCKTADDCDNRKFEACIDSHCYECKREDYSKHEECKNVFEQYNYIIYICVAVAMVVLIAGIAACCCCCGCCPGYKWRNQRKMNRAEARKYQAEDNGGSTFATYRPTPSGTGGTPKAKDEPPPAFEFPTDDH